MENNNYEKFVEFLKENNCYYEFMENYNNDSDSSGISLEQYCVKSPTVTGYVLGAFRWNEPYIKFWTYLDDKWRKELKNNKL